MDMYIIKWTRLQLEILRFFFMKAGEKFSVRDIARFLNRSPTAISNSLPELNEQGLIKINKIKGANLMFVEFNRDSDKAIELKRVENLRLVYESGLADFLRNEFPGSLVILFGSYSKGEDIFSSDIDIAVIGAREEEKDLSKFSRLIGREIIINFYQSFKDIHKHLKENILNGIVLSGSVEL